jgi:hypothetical protein
MKAPEYTHEYKQMTRSKRPAALSSLRFRPNMLLGNVKGDFMRKTSVLMATCSWLMTSAASLLGTLGFACLGLAAQSSATAAKVFIPDFKVKPDDYTILTGCVGKHPEEAKPFRLDHRQLQLTNWKLGSRSSWEVEVVEPGEYEVNVLFNHSVAFPLEVEVSAGSSKVSQISTQAGALGQFVDPDGLGGPVHIVPQSWRRFPLGGALHLPPGKVNIVLTINDAKGQKEGAIELLSVELVKKDAKERLRQRAAAFRSQGDTEWFRSVKYGLMVHWHTWSAPQHGARLPYLEAVRAFNVERFVEQVVATGAGFASITISHTNMVCPAPIKSLDAVLPGRTSQRDLIGEIADGLGKHGVRLFLYYHLGCNSDPEWQRASGFWEKDTTQFWDNWCSVISEIGERYGDKLAGWWFDDGTANYYYRSAPWEKLANTCLRGNQKRLVGFNPWILPPATEFQHFLTGEGHTDPTVTKTLKPGDNGIISSGMYAGMQASAAVTMEAGSWGHDKLDTEMLPPQYTSERLAGMMRQFIALGNVPMLNCSVYQDGTISPKAVEVIQGMNALLAKP